MKKHLISQYTSVLLIYGLSRLVVALGFFFTAFFTTKVLQIDSPPPHLQHLRGEPFRWLSVDAELALPPPPPGTTALAIQAWPVRENLDVVVSVAGEQVQTLRLAADIHEYHISLPLSAIEEARQRSEPLRVAFRSAAYRPQELTQGRLQDTRLLAFCLTHVSYFPSQGPPFSLTDADLFTRGAYAVEWAGGTINFLSFLRTAVFQWDAGWYGSIVEGGYAYQAGFGSEQNTRFFPLYPLICRGLRTISQLPLDLAMWSVANAFAIAAVLLFSDLAKKTLPLEAAWCAVVLFCFYPGSLFFSLAYAESLMALLTVLFLRFLQQQKFTLAALTAGLATACRSTGVALIPALAWAYYASSRAQPTLVGRKLLFGAGLLALSVSGLVAYALYLQWQFNDALAFARPHLALHFWPEEWKWALVSGMPIRRTLLRALWYNPLSLFVVPSAFDALALAGALLLLVAVIRQAPSAWLIVGICLAAIPYGIFGGSSQGVTCMTRFLAVDVPLFLCGGLFLLKHGSLSWLPGVAVILATTLFVFSSLFAAGYFVG